MLVSRKWLIALFRAESMRDSFLHESKLESILDLPAHADSHFQNFRDAKRACLYAAKKIMCE